MPTFRSIHIKRRMYLWRSPPFSTYYFVISSHKLTHLRDKIFILVRMIMSVLLVLVPVVSTCKTTLGYFLVCLKLFISHRIAQYPLQENVVVKRHTSNPN